MMRGLTRGRRTSVMTAVVLSVAVFGAEMRPARAQAFHYRLTLAGVPPSAVTAFELGADARNQHTLTVTVASAALSDLPALQVGQRFDFAMIEVFDGLLNPLRTFQLSPARVQAVQTTGNATSVTLNLILSGRTVAVMAPS